jgi:hypothetical protein
MGLHVKFNISIDLPNWISVNELVLSVLTSRQLFTRTHTYKPIQTHNVQICRAEMIYNEGC